MNAADWFDDLPVVGSPAHKRVAEKALQVRREARLLLASGLSSQTSWLASVARSNSDLLPYEFGIFGMSHDVE